ncbi:hypothetical protein KDX31_12850 [Amphritea atlantica]|uniref:Electron transfer flavoprotein alpha/beta-subunit N-terminal domain-containing protein n=1 Tax=Amphritea atlantica TaxID=355243 RepID=A0ABY5GQJ9_9GAMM|nr:hypothetical protein KDX31_12850 [Amphritea atlantica]
MKITVILTPEASEGDKAVLGNQALESISEALKLKLSGRAQEIKVVAIGQPLSETLRVRLLRQGVDYTLFRACDRCPGLMELAEQFIGIIHMESPDLIFIGRGDNDRQSQLGNMLAELLEFRLSQSVPLQGQLYRTLVIREIGNGMHTVRVSLLKSESDDTGCSERGKASGFGKYQVLSG